MWAPNYRAWEAAERANCSALPCSAPTAASRSTGLHLGRRGWGRLHSLYFHRCFPNTEHRVAGASAPRPFCPLSPCSAPRPLTAPGRGGSEPPAQRPHGATGIALAFVLNSSASPGSDAGREMVNALITIIKSCQFNYS